MPIIIDHITLDEDIVEKQLKNDFRDDWFPDALGYSDYFDAGLLPSIVAKNFDRHHGQYEPSKASLLNIPKSNFTLRYALETSIADRAVYHALAVQLQAHFDKLISWRAFSHRLPTNVALMEERRSSVKYTFRPSVRAWSDFLGCVQERLAAGAVLLSTDLANYFENINLELLRNAMEGLVPQLDGEAAQKAKIRGQIEQLFNYLPHWSYSAERGLPQNRDASSFLANVYMRPVDAAMIGKGYEYFRYMDDIKVVCDDEATARKALKDLILMLRPLGQSVNSGKTAIVSSEDSKRVAELLNAGSVEMKRIASAWQSKSLKSIQRSFLPLKRLTLEVLRANRYDSREFRFCINRLETLARCAEFDVPAAFFAEMTSLVIDGLEHAPVATDSICRYLRAVDLSEEQLLAIFGHLADQKKAIYNWKNYRIWILLTQKEFRSEASIHFAKETIKAHGDDPTRAGATVYLGAMGSQADRHFIAERFHSLSSFLGQRAAIIGAQEVHFKARKKGGISINEHVRPHLRADLLGCYKALSRRGVYVSALEPLSITNFVDFERDYD